MKSENTVQKTADYVKHKLEGEGSGHDWWHIYRVWQMSKLLQQIEGGNRLVVELAALIHDLIDRKFIGGDIDKGIANTETLLMKMGVDSSVIEQVVIAASDVTFSKSIGKEKPRTKEGEIVQDADRLDAIGAVGIARCFSYGGSKNRLIYDPNNKPKAWSDPEAYKRSNTPSINHFYEKLLLLKDLINTQTAQKIAEERHQVMVKFLDQFYAEWDGKK